MHIISARKRLFILIVFFFYLTPLVIKRLIYNDKGVHLLVVFVRFTFVSEGASKELCETF